MAKRKHVYSCFSLILILVSSLLKGVHKIDIFIYIHECKQVAFVMFVIDMCQNCYIYDHTTLSWLLPPCITSPVARCLMYYCHFIVVSIKCHTFCCKLTDSMVITAAMCHVTCTSVMGHNWNCHTRIIFVTSIR